jgi:hypothetical protein
MCQTGTSKTYVWRWQERFIAAVKRGHQALNSIL